MVTVFTQAYNAEAYLSPCIESVLGQTCGDFRYVLIDDGSTDGTADIMRRYAGRDPRIRVIRDPVNRRETRWLKLLDPAEVGAYLTVLDADDWWTPDYLERLLALAEETGADIVCTGTVMHQMADGGTAVRRVDRRMVLDRGELVPLFSEYHREFRAFWGKLIRPSLFRSAVYPAFSDYGTMYGWDTAVMLAVLRQARRICVDNAALYHYRIYPASVSYRYDLRRFDADVFRYRSAMEFLLSAPPMEFRNEAYVAVVFANDVKDTIQTLDRSGLAPAEQLREYRKISTHPVTRDVFRRKYPGVKAIDACKRALLEGILHGAARLEAEDENLAAALEPLLADRPLLREAARWPFLRDYGGVCLRVWDGDHGGALEEMTGLLFGGAGEDETFLSLYLSLAALENYAPAFLFGKERLARLYAREGRTEACRRLLEELRDMGVEAEL